MRTIQVYYPNPNTGVLEMRFDNKSPEQLDGIQVLLQRITKLFLTQIGSNRFNPGQGSAIGDKTVLSLNISDKLQATVLIHEAVNYIQSYILAEQSAVAATTPLRQQLDHLEVSDIIQLPEDPTSIYAEIIVYTKDNQSYFLTV